MTEFLEDDFNKLKCLSEQSHLIAEVYSLTTREKQVISRSLPGMLAR